MSRLTCGKLTLNVEDVDLATMLDEVAQGARAILRGKPVVVEVDCRVARVSTDPMRLRQILNNLATNAAKFTDTGTIAIRVTVDQGATAFEVRE